MKASTLIFITILILILSITGCNLPSGQPESLTPNAYTAAALTVTSLAATEQAGPTQPTPTLFATLAPPTAASTNTSAPPPQPPQGQATSTPSGTYFVVDVGANCRTGPGINYDRIASFAQGSYVLLVGRNTDRSWWLLKTGNMNCWISATTGHTTGPLDSIPEVQAPPTPTVVVTVTSYP